MSKVITITFNPCIDKSTLVPELIAGRKLKCAPPVYEAGGGGINVARALKRLGTDVLSIYPYGGNTGLRLNEFLKDHGVLTYAIPVKGETRENFIVTESMSGKQYRFGMPGLMLSEDHYKNIIQFIKESKEVEYIVISGSFPPGLPPSVIETIATICVEKKVRLIIDSPGDTLKHVQLAHVFLIKPNIGELAKLAGITFIEKKDIVRTGQSIIRYTGCTNILVSMGEEGAMLITDKSSLMIKAPKVHTISVVGAGDSMVAGLISGLLNGKKLEEAAMFAIACGTAATMNTGTELCHADDARNLFELIRKDTLLTV